MAEKRQTPKSGQIYKHFKGSLYQVDTIAVHTETSDKLVVYHSVEKPDRVFARPLDMFMSEVDRFRYPLIKAKYRFTLLVEETEAECDNKDNEGDKTETGNIQAGNENAQDEIKAPELSEELTPIMNPILEKILDEKDYQKKIENFELLRNKCTDEILTTLAISLDIQLEGETIEDKYAQILKTLRMHERYESARLRV